MIDEQKMIRELSELLETDSDPLRQRLYHAFLNYIKNQRKIDFNNLTEKEKELFVDMWKSMIQKQAEQRCQPSEKKKME